MTKLPELRARVSTWLRVVGRTIGEAFVWLIMLCMYLAATWSIGLWLLVGAVAFVAADALKKRWERMPLGGPGVHFRAKAVDGVREVLGRMLLALALVTGIQVFVNVFVWLFDNWGARDALSDWLLRNQASLSAARSGLVHMLRPRVTLSVLAIALLVGTVRPSWRLVERYANARKYISRVLQIGTVVVSVAFVTSEYAASYERTFAETRVSLIERERVERDKQERRIFAAHWLRDVLGRSTPADCILYREYMDALPSHEDAKDVMYLETDALEKRWGLYDAQGVGVRSDSSRNEASPGETSKASLSPSRAAVDFLSGPGDARPLYADWEREHGLTKALTARAREAQRAVVEAANVLLGEASPHGIVELFVGAIEDAASDTFIPRWLARRQTRAAEARGDQPTAGAAGTPTLAETIGAEVEHQIGSVPAASTAAELRLRLQLAVGKAHFERLQHEEMEARTSILEAESNLSGAKRTAEAPRRMTPLEVLEPVVVEAVEHGAE